MDTKQPEALRIADDLHHSITHYGGEDASTLAAYEAEKCLRALHTEKEMLIAGYDAARLEIESLQAQLAAVGAGGVESLRKRECLHQISEPAQPDELRAALAAAPAQPVAPAKAARQPLTDGYIFDWWRSENGLENCKLIHYHDFAQAVRAIEAAHGIK